MKKFEQLLIKEAQSTKSEKQIKTEGSVGWKSPSNIAIVKYWGKRPGQIPANASVSMTLNNSFTKTMIAYKFSVKIKGPKLNFTFEGEPNETFTNRIESFLNSIVALLPWLEHTELSINSENSFPHSSGIASSASAMSALALCLCEIEEELYGKSITGDFYKKASFIARLGSGSASRSVYANMAVWGMTSCRPLSSDEFAIPVTDIHPDLMEMRNSILIINSGKKHVTSSMGHELMKSNPYAKLRFEAAEENMQRLCRVVKEGEFGQFIDIMENEALSLHAMMMTSTPGFLLMKPNTLEAIERLRLYRMESGLSIGFTLDAGANLHVMYPKKQEQKAKSFIESDLKILCENELIIHDKMGKGPVKLN